MMQPVQLSDALPMEMKAPAEPKKPKDTKPVLKAESDADEIEDPLPDLVVSPDSGGEGGPQESDGSDSESQTEDDAVSVGIRNLLSDTKEKFFKSGKGRGSAAGQPVAK